MTMGEAGAERHAMSVPSPRSDLVGRAEALSELRALIAQGLPVITVVATGGAGKTRLALAASNEHIVGFDGQVFFVPLAGVTEAAGVPAAVAGVLQVRASADRTVDEAVGDALRHRSTLLVLDNFEQVLAAAPFVSWLSERCPLLTVLITSRAPLRVRGEIVYELAPLPTKSPDDAGVLLFCQRARSASPSFRMDPEVSAGVLALCARLDGLPLAIELAASWSATLTPAELLARFDGSGTGTLALLANGSIDAPERHQTLQRTIDWSLRLLSIPEQELFLSLSVFESGCTFNAMSQVCSPTADEVELLANLAALVRLRLVVVEPGKPSRYRMLETIREFAAAELLSRTSDQVLELRRRHCLYFQAMANEAKTGLESRDDSVWLHRLEADHLNLRAAFTELDRQGDVVAGLRMASALGWFWRHSGRGEQGRSRLEQLYVKASDVALDGVTEGDALIMIGRLSAESGLIGRGRAGAEASIASLEHGLLLHRRHGEPGAMMRALESVVTGLVQHEHTDRAALLCQEGLALAEAEQHSWWVPMFLYSKVILHQMNGELDAAEAAAERARAMSITHDDHRLAAIGTLLMGTTQMFAARIDDAEQNLEEAYNESLAHGDQRNSAFAAVSLGALLLSRDLRAAARWTSIGLALAQAVSEWRCIGFGLTGLTFIAAKAGDHSAAARFHGVISADVESFYRAMPPEERQRLDRLTERIRVALGDRAFEHEAGIGSRYSRSSAIEEGIRYADALASGGPVDAAHVGPDTASARHASGARAPDSVGRSVQVSPQDSLGGLSAREIDVLVLLASGRTNRQIAEHLSISVATIERHLVNLYRKIGVRRRTEAMGFAIKHQLVDATLLT